MGYTVRAAVTYSIVAHDPVTGQLGVAVQSHWFSVGSVVPWARPGVGAVATQANARTDYGPRGLELMAGGASPEQALSQLREEDGGGRARQVAMVDVAGEVACWTGPDCMAFAGDAQGDGVSCQANIMRNETVWGAMLDAYMWESGPLARRLFAALVAAEEAGGDLRGKQSAAILVVPAQGEWWERLVALSVEDTKAPLPELERLLRLHDAYETASDADYAVSSGEYDRAAEGYRRAAELAPESEELRFWGALGKAQSGDDDAAVAQLRALFSENPDWRTLLERLRPATAPNAERLLTLLGG
jgi:uncharacterized Ntn-hydrolase superfamily protein